MMDRIILMAIISFLFATTLYQAREIGKQGTVIAVQNATMKHEKEMNIVKEKHQTVLAGDKASHQVEVDGYKNELTEMASSFEDMGLSDSTALGKRESGWLNEFMRRNSRPASNNSPNDKDIPPTDPDKADKAGD